jgi:hypothetical protein
VDLTGVGDVKNVASTSPPIYMAYIVTCSLHVHIRRGGRIQLFSIEL